jgi:asparagine synthase (glutamine-hydrolysing)
MSGEGRVLSVSAEATRGGWVARFANGRLSVDSAEPVESGPQVAQLGSCRVVFDGALDNRSALGPEVADRLRANETDAELILGAYLRRGEQLLSRLRGSFAFVLWDDRQRRLLCVRDQLGAHALFTAADGDALLISPSIDALLAQPRVSKSVNRLLLVDHLRHRWLDPEETYFEAVRRVPPGHFLRVDYSASELRRYWDPAPPGSAFDWIGPEELDRFDELLEQAVRRDLTRGRAGIFLSGGLDSVSIAAVAAAASRSSDLPDPWALSLVFPDPECNEEILQRRVASDLGLAQVLLPLQGAVGARGVLRAAVDVSGRSPAPLINFWAPAYDALALEGKARGCSIVLSGVGGDEWLTVNPYYAADLIRTLNIVGLYRLYWSLQRSYQVSVLYCLRTLLWKFGARRLVGPAAKSAVRGVAPSMLRSRRRRKVIEALPAWLAVDNDLREQIVARELEADPDLARDAPSIQKSPPSHPREYIDRMRPLVDSALTALEMEEALEQGRRVGMNIRYPFWDVDLVEFLYRTPPELLNSGGRSKGLARETLQRRFPDVGFERQRKVSAARFAQSMFAQEGGLIWRERGGTPSLAAAGLVDAKAGDAAVEELISGRRPREAYRIWDLLSLDSWLESRL